MKKKLTAIIAIIMCVLTLSLSVAPAFAAAPASTTATTPWSNFPVQKHYHYNENYTRAIQTVLRYLGDPYSGVLGTIDGKFGPKTENAVAVFQTANGLENDGIVGPDTWAALYNCLVEDIEPPFPIAPDSLYRLPIYYKVRGHVLFRNNRNTNIWCVLLNPGAPEEDRIWQQFNPEQ